MTSTTDPSVQQPRQPSHVRAVVLVEQPPSGIGEVLDTLQPGMGTKLRGVPLPALDVTVNGFTVSFAIDAQPLVARELDYAVSQSAARRLVEEAVARHRGFLTLRVAVGDDVHGASALLANVAATFADDPNGLAVWLPDADHATTDVLYAGETEQRSAQVWFHTMAARIDEATSLAHTIGVTHLGGHDVQLRSPLAPADAHGALRGAVATLLEARSFPMPGATIAIAGVPHVLQPAQSIIGMGPVLDAVPTGAAPAPAGQPAQQQSGWKRLFGR